MNASGVATQTLDYLPYGDVRVNAKQTSYDSDRKYLSKINDTTTNLDYLEARYYQAPLGRFISQDPILLGVPDDKILVDPQVLNYYGYSSDNPINKSDPSGLFNVSTGKVELGDTLPSVVSQLNGAYGKKYGITFTDDALYKFNNNTYPTFGKNYGFAINLGFNGTVMSVGGGNLGYGSIGPRTYSDADFALSFGVEGTANAERKIMMPLLSAVKEDIVEAYKRPSGATNQVLRDFVKGKACVTCGSKALKMVADHIYPLVQEFYETGTINLERMKSIEAIQPQCATCSASQGGVLSNYSKMVKEFLGIQ